MTARTKVLLIYFFLFAGTFALYFNTIKNEYALDDEIIISGNRYVQQGISGIPDIFKQDIFASYYENYNAKQQLSGGRYRPLSVASFAIDHALFGPKPGMSHLVNAMLYALSIVVLFRMLNGHLKYTLTGSLIIALFFALHPLHTEVVANIKSRDELLCLLFSLFAAIAAIRYQLEKKAGQLILSMVCFLAACMSKEFAASFLLIIPAIFYLHLKVGFIKSLRFSLWLLIPFGLYLFLRIYFTGIAQVDQLDPLNDAYLYANSHEHTATRFYVLLLYLKLLLIPYPLSADYSYAQIAYRTFSDPLVWLSVIIHAGLIFLTIRAFQKKHPLALAGLIYFSNLLLVSNFIFNIGASMGERLVYHSSLGFCLFAGYYLEKLFLISDKKAFRFAYYFLASFVTIVFIKIILERNGQWKNTNTLFLHDVEVVPNSCLANSNAAVALITPAMLMPDSEAKRQQLLRGSAYATKAVQIHPSYVNAMINAGVASFGLENYQEAMQWWKKASKLYPKHPVLIQNAELVYRKGLDAGARKDIGQAVFFLEWAVKLKPSEAHVWADLGGAYFTASRLQDALIAFEKAAAINPANEHANRALPYIRQQLQLKGNTEK